MSGLSVRGLTVTPPGLAGPGVAPAAEDVSFSAPRGAITAVLGAAGAGKTLLLACVAGLLKPDRGAVFVDGVDLTARVPRRGIGLLAPGTDLGASRTLGASLRRVAGRGQAAAVMELMQSFGLAELADRRLSALTHGQGFAALAVSRLLPAGEGLLVDDAGTGLDPAMRGALMEALAGIAASGRFVVMATRDTDLAMRADHLVLLRRGRVLQAGTPAQLYLEPRDAAAAVLTGSANVVRGMVRQKMAGGFIWAAGGRKFAQASPAAAVPLPMLPLGGDVALCLRPHQLSQGEGDNQIQACVRRVTHMGEFVQLRLDSPLGPLVMKAPGRAGQTSAYWPGQVISVGWATDVAWLLQEAPEEHAQPAAPAVQRPRMTVA
jgi:ABC-type sulfate/molybdate transport systems ATPase subunit